MLLVKILVIYYHLFNSTNKLYFFKFINLIFAKIDIYLYFCTQINLS